MRSAQVWGQLGSPRLDSTPRLLENLRLQLLLKFLLKSLDFELLLAQTGQVPIFGFLSARKSCTLGPGTKSCALSGPKVKSHVPFAPKLGRQSNTDGTRRILDHLGL